jgi:TrmH family RNA methyltransferase
MGAVFRVPIDAGADLPEGGLRIALVPGAPDAVWATDLTGPVVLVVGAERHGLPPELVERCDATCSIPQAAVADSLNAAQAATLSLYEAARQRAAATATG